MTPKKQLQLNKMDIVLIAVGIVMLLFTREMIITYHTMGSIPDTLCISFYGACAGEAGVMGWIKTTKTRSEKETEQHAD